MRKFMHDFLHAENGATAIEYGLIVGLMVVVIIAAIAGLGQTVVNVLYTRIQGAL